MRVRQFTKHDFVTAGPFAGIHELKKLLLNSSAIVIMDNDRFIGVLTPNDIVRKPHLLAIDCLQPKSQISPNLNIDSALLIMADENTDVLPVFYKNVMEGLIFKDDIHKYFRKNNDELKFKIKSYQIELEARVLKRTIELSNKVINNDKFMEIFMHELKNPLAITAQLLSLLIKDLYKYDNEKIQEILNTAHQSTLFTYELMLNLPQWLNSKSDKPSFNPVRLNVCELLIEEINGIKAFAEQKSVIINNQIPLNICALADRNMLKSIFRNLINNAIKFSYSNGQISIYSKTTNKHIEITIKDGGTGLSSKKKETIFKKGQPSYPGTNNEIGFGIGLLICKEFIELNAGQIWVESESSPGSEFKFTLPLFIEK